MSRRYATRSTTSVIDLTQAMPRVQSRRRKSEANASISTIVANPVNERRVDEERTVKTRNDSVNNDQKRNTQVISATLPCFNNSFTGTPEIMTCSICFEALSASREPMATRCGHVFCARCLAMSLENFKRCPTCQSIAKFSTSIRLYF